MNPLNNFIKSTVTFVLTALILFFHFKLSLAQPVMLVKDTLPGRGGVVRQLTDVNGMLFFEASDGSTGREVWKSDGTVNGTMLVKDILPGGLSSSPAELTNFNGVLFFDANSSLSERELWKSDGTTVGTVIVSTYPTQIGGLELTVLNSSTLLFFRFDDSTGTELWKSDGTTAGTVLVKDIYPGPGNGFIYHTPRPDAIVNGTFYFSGNDSISGNELWKSDGTEAGTVLVKDINPGPGGSRPDYMTDVNGTLFFTARDGSSGTELWKSDGTAAGTMLVKDIMPGPGSSIDDSTFFQGERNLVSVNNALFFRANDGVYGEELWVSDGTAPGTMLVKDINPGPSSSLSYVVLTNANGTLFFQADDGANGPELWKSDGTAVSTVLVKDINPGPGGSSPSWFSALNDLVYCNADDGTHGKELWKSNGSAAGTSLVKDIWPGPSSSFPQELIVSNGTLFFTADDGAVGSELWALRAPITTTLSPINPPIQIPPSGGSFNFDATLANISGRAETRDVWNTITAPNGKTFTTIGPAALTLPSAFSGMRTLNQQIPGGAPAGLYTYAFNVGAYPDTVESSDSFTFTKSVSPSALQNSELTERGGWTVLDAQTGQPLNLDDWSAVTIDKKSIETATSGEPIPQQFVLHQNYPNPFNPSTTIRYQLPTSEKVRIVVYDVLGRQVRELVNREHGAGVYSVQWDGRNQAGQMVATGLYIYQIQAGHFAQKRKMLFLK